MKKRVFALVLAGTMLAGLLVGCGKKPAASGGDSSEVKQQDLVMGTGSSGGTYFALGAAMAEAMNADMNAISITAQASGASVENMKLINAGEMDLGLAMNSVAANAWEGVNAFDASTENVRCIGVVYHEVYQIVADGKTGAKNVSDLKGLKVAVGPAGSGTIGCTALVLEAAGLSMDDVKGQNDSFGDAATKLQDGHIQAACNVLAVPASSIQELTVSMDLAYIDISDTELAYIQAQAPYYTRLVIPAGTYNKQTEDINTITCQAALYCSKDLSEETIYEITKQFYENAETIAAAHSAGKDISVAGALDGITTPVHKGAAKYFAEKGLTVDPSLLID